MIVQIIILVIGIIGLFSLTNQNLGLGLIAFACLLGICQLLSYASKQKKGEK